MSVPPFHIAVDGTGGHPRSPQPLVPLVPETWYILLLCSVRHRGSSAQSNQALPSLWYFLYLVLGWYVWQCPARGVIRGPPSFRGHISPFYDLTSDPPLMHSLHSRWSPFYPRPGVSWVTASVEGYGGCSLVYILSDALV